MSKSLPPSVVELGGETFGRELGLVEVMTVSLMMELLPLIRRGRETMVLILSAMGGHSEKMVICRPRGRLPPGTSHAGPLHSTSSLQTMRNKFLVKPPPTVFRHRGPRQDSLFSLLSLRQWVTPLWFLSKEKTSPSSEIHDVLLRLLPMIREQL